MIRRLLASMLLLFVGAGCASVNRQHYEEPLYKMDVLEHSGSDINQLEEVSGRELENQQPGQRPPLASDEAGIWMAMDKAEESYKTGGNRIRNRELDDYLHDIACRMTPEYCEDIRIYVLRVPYFNATMAPNGALAIWSGLLLRTTNEAQLAAVIGHEIGHYLRRHSLQRLHEVKNASSALVIVQLAAAAAGYSAVGDLAYLAAMGGLQAYSRDQEREADGYGLALMAKGGYEPHETGRLWQQVIKEVEASDDKNFSILLFDSHPPSEERLEALDDLADRITAPPHDFATNSETFRTHVLPLRYQFLQDELHLRDFARIEVLLEYLIADGAALGELYHFKGELHRLRGREGDQDQAIEAYEKAMTEAEFPPETLRALGLIYLKKGDKAKARQAFNEYLERKPDCADREMIIHMLSKESL